MTATTTETPQSRPLSARARRRRRERRLFLGTALLIVGAWLYGYFGGAVEIGPLAGELLPAAASVRREGEIYVGRDETGEIVGYVAAGEAPGYGGPVELLVGTDPAGNIVGVHFVSQHESPGFFRLLQSNDFLAQFVGRTSGDPLRLGQDLDAVSGATLSAEGVAGAVRAATATLSAKGVGSARPDISEPIQFGLPELVLLLLFASAYVGHRWRNGAWKRRVRWGTLLLGMVVLGFIYTAPLTITMVISLLSGYWPDWHNNLYWYLLLGGILFVTTVDAKNPYCYWFCPFGAVQECLAAVSGAKFYRPRRYAELLRWVQRGLALAAIVLGLALRRPGVAGYEPFATLFDLRGSTLRWVLLLLVLLASLAIYRPFCNYICPLDPVVDFIAAGRRWGKEARKRWRNSATTA